MTNIQQVMIAYAVELKKMDTNKTLSECVDEIIAAAEKIKE